MAPAILTSKKFRVAVVNISGGCIGSGGSSSWTVTLWPTGVFGVWRATVQRWIAGDWSAFNASSTARTCSTCSPGSRSVNTSCGSQPPKPSKSSEHSNTALPSLPAKPKYASMPAVGSGGPYRIAVSGGIVSTTVHA